MYIGQILRKKGSSWCFKFDQISVKKFSILPPGIPNWSGQHQERRLGTVPSVTETMESSPASEDPPTTCTMEDPVDFSLLGGNIKCFSFIFKSLSYFPVHWINNTKILTGHL